MGGSCLAAVLDDPKSDARRPTYLGTSLLPPEVKELIFENIIPANEFKLVAV
jgi:hypothetical protein